MATKRTAPPLQVVQPVALMRSQPKLAELFVGPRATQAQADLAQRERELDTLRNGVGLPGYQPYPPNDPGANQGSTVPGQGPPAPVAHLPGGQMLLDVQHPIYRGFQHMESALADQSWFAPTVSPSSFVKFQIGVFVVPEATHYWMFDYEFVPYRPLGGDPNDFVPIEDGRLSASMGFDLTIDQSRLNDLSYQLDPVPVTFARPAFQPQVNNNRGALPQQAFNAAAASSFATGAGPGTSLLPTLHRGRQGARNVPFTLIAKAGQVISTWCVIFRPLNVPLGWIQAYHTGTLVNAQLSDELLGRMRPR